MATHWILRHHLSLILGLVLALCAAQESVWAQASPTTSQPTQQQLIEQIKDARTRKDWDELKRIGNEAIKRRPKDWGGWFLIGEAHLNRAELKEAIAALRQTVALNPEFAQGWNTLGNSYLNNGNEQEAVNAYEKAAQIEPNTVMIWFNLWHAHNAAGNREKVREIYLKVKGLDPELAKRGIARFGQPDDPAGASITQVPTATKPNDPKAIKEALSALETAEKYISEERIQESLSLLERAHKTLSSHLGSGSDEALSARDSLLFVYGDLNRISDALSLSGPRNYSRGIAVMKSIHQRRTVRYGVRGEPTIRAATGLAYALSRSGGVAEALQLITTNYASALETLGESHRSTLTAGLVKRDLYASVGRNDEALVLAERLVSVSLQHYGETDPLTLAAMWNLGLSKKRSDGIPHLEKVVQAFTNRLGEEKRQTIAAMSSLGHAYVTAGRKEEGLQLLKRATELAERVFGADDPETAQKLLTLAVAYFTAQKIDEAVVPVRRSLNINRKILGESHPSTLAAKQLLAIAYISQHRTAEALVILQDIIPALEAQRASSGLSVEERQTLFAQFAPIYRAYAMVLSQRNLEESFRIGELSKARTLLESTAIRRANDSGILSEADVARIREYEKHIGDLNDRLANVSGNHSLKAKLESEKTVTARELTSFRADLIKRYPKYGRLSDVKIIGANEGRNLIPENTVFLSFLEQSEMVLVFALDSSGQLTAKVIPKVTGLREKLEKFRELLANTTATDTITSQSSRNLKVNAGDKPVTEPQSLQELSEFFGKLFLDPVAQQLRGKRAAIISPDGSLAVIPFEALLFDGKPLVMTHDVSYAQSLSMLGLLKERKEEYRSLLGRMDLLAMGGATYSGKYAEAPKPTETPREFDLFERISNAFAHLVGAVLKSIHVSDSKTEQVGQMITASRGDPSAINRAFELLDAKWENLPGSEREVIAATEIFGVSNTMTFTRGDASEQKLQELNQKKQLRQYKRLLFSTHGYLSTYEPALSSIVLSQTNKTPLADGYITASEWPAYDLNSDLVVLSACETGLGKVIQGEGVLGLPFALYVAGNTNTVLTLWSIMDDSTSEFVQRFFRKLKNGVPESAALSQTKREFISESKYERPVFWAPFVLYGY